MDDEMLAYLRQVSIEEERTVSNLAGKIIKEWMVAHKAARERSSK